MIEWLNDWMIEWLNDWMIELEVCIMTGLLHWMIAMTIELALDCLYCWYISWLIVCTGWINDFNDWVIKWLNDWMIKKLNDWVIEWF